MVVGKEEKSTVAEQLEQQQHAMPMEKAAVVSAGSSAQAEAVIAQPVVVTQELQQELQKVMTSSFNVALLFVRSAEFRGLINDLTKMVVNIAADRWQEIQPSFEQAVQEPTAETINQAAQQLQGAASSISEDLSNEATRERALCAIQTWLGRINSREDFRCGVRDMLKAVNEFKQRIDCLVGAVKEDPDVVEYIKHMEAAHKEAKKLLERFSSGQALELTLTHLKQIVEDARSNMQLSNYLTNWAGFFNHSLTDPEFVKSDAWRKEAHQLLQQARQAIERDQQHIQAFLQEVLRWLQAWNVDVEVQKFANIARDLVNRTFFDNEGHPLVQPGSFVALENIFNPLMQEVLKLIFIPVLYVDDENVSFVMANVLLRGEDILPDTVVIEKYEKVVASKSPLAALEEEEMPTRFIHITAKGMRADAKQICMAYQRKTFPKISDVVSFDAQIGGDGLTIDVVLTASNKPNCVFDVTSVNATIDELTLQNIYGIEHSHVLYTIFKPALQYTARYKLSDAICDALTCKLVELDNLLVDFKDKIAFFVGK